MLTVQQICNSVVLNEYDESIFSIIRTPVHHFPWNLIQVRFLSLNINILQLDRINEWGL